MPISIFLSYAHADESHKDQLLKHLAPLKRDGLITGWHDRLISPGDDWARRINHELDACELILLLVSVDFLASTYCWGVELTRAMERHNAGTARVIPIIIRTCDWKTAPFNRLQMLPRDAKPVADWKPRDKAWTHIAEEIRELITQPNHPKAKPMTKMSFAPKGARSSEANTGSPNRQSRVATQAPGSDDLFTVFTKALAKEGETLAKTGAKQLVTFATGAIASAFSPDPGPTFVRIDAILNLLSGADPNRLAKILMRLGRPVPLPEMRATEVARYHPWNAVLVDEAFTAAQLRTICKHLDLPINPKPKMALAVVRWVKQIPARRD